MRFSLSFLLTNLVEIVFSAAPIIKMICILVGWLHIRAGVSRLVTNKVLQAVQFILSTTLYLIEIALGASGIHVKLSNLDLPQDIRTAYQLHSSEPEIIRTVCCPTCFSLIPNPVPFRCQWQESRRSQPCNTELWTKKNTSKGPKWIPKRMYSTQSFDSWLRFFLSRQVIEDSLRDTFRQRTNGTPPGYGGEMRDIQDSPAWRDLNSVFQTPYDLVFGIFVDWFNPFGNKIAGK